VRLDLKGIKEKELQQELIGYLLAKSRGNNSKTTCWFLCALLISLGCLSVAMSFKV